MSLQWSSSSFSVCEEHYRFIDFLCFFLSVIPFSWDFIVGFSSLKHANVTDAMPEYRLTYFNAMGRAEPIRLLFAQAGEKYQDRRIEKPDWPSLKHGQFTADTSTDGVAWGSWNYKRKEFVQSFRSSSFLCWKSMERCYHKVGPLSDIWPSSLVGSRALPPSLSLSLSLCLPSLSFSHILSPFLSLPSLSNFLAGLLLFW